MNGVCHIEIPSKDYEKAKKFYGDLFGWQFEYMSEMDYMVFKATDGPCGGFDKNLESCGTKGITLYIEVADIEATIKKAGEIGGKCLKGKTQITPEIGYYAFLEDLEGNRMGLWAKN